MSSAHAHPQDPRQEWNPELRAPDGGKGRGVLIGLIVILSRYGSALPSLSLPHQLGFFSSVM